MAILELHGLAKNFGEISVLKATRPQFGLRRNAGDRGRLGLRKIDAAAAGGGAGERQRRADLLDGADITRQDPSKRDIAMVFQNYALYPHMSVAQNMGYALKLRGESRAAIAAKVEEAAALLGLGDLLARRPGQLSGGQRQRVAMGRAIVRQPKLFLFDEPLSNLDAKLRVSMRAEIRRLQKRLGITSLYVTHDQVEAMTMADRLIVMEAGRAAQIAAPMEVFERPASRFVAQFMGAPAMNIFDPVQAGMSNTPPGTVAGIRPEYVEVVAEGMPLAVDLVEPLGAETLIHGTLRCGQRLTLRRAGPPPPADGLHVRLPEEALHFFDAASGLRLSP